MKPSERIKEIQEKNRMTGKYWSLELAIFDYLDEEYEKKVKHEKYLKEKQIREESNNL